MLNYERFGSGPTAVFIHGFLGSSKIYDSVRHELAAYYDTILIDFAGHGNSLTTEVEPNIYAYAQQIAEVLHHENVTSSTWIGHSMGGYIVLAALEKNIATIEKAVLAYSSVSADDDTAKKKRDASIEKIENEGKEAFVDGVIPNFFKNNTATKNIETACQIGYEASKKGLITALQTMKERPNQEDLLTRLKLPILIIEGSEDGVVPSITTNNPTVIKVQTNTGHLGMMEEPEQFMQHLKSFI
ncbi:MAG: alpha/beta hydrolase [Lysinibacillus sp.]